MNTHYDRKLIILDTEAESKELELRAQKLYTREDIEEVTEKWKMRCGMAIGITTVFITLLISILHR